MTSIESRGNLAPILVATVAFGGPALLNTASVEAVQRPVAHVRDIGALPTAKALQAPALVAGESGVPELSAATSTKAEVTSTYSMVDEETGPLSTTQTRSDYKKCKYIAGLSPGAPGKYKGMKDITPQIYARAVPNEYKSIKYIFKVRKNFVPCKIIGSMRDDDSNSVYYIKPSRKKDNTLEVSDVLDDYYDIESIQLLARPKHKKK